ncbi:hypothetical protein MRB53_040548 [Persea americana]|nr:hypothetical protein MRB53_040548 [Persea americana]
MSVTMLNSSSISALLTANTDPQLYPRIYLMTLAGTALAYSTPANVQDVQDRMALVSMAWRDQQTQPGSKDKPALKALTIESHSINVIALAMQPNLLLVLEGAVGGWREKTNFKMTAERIGDEAYPRGKIENLMHRDSSTGEAIDDETDAERVKASRNLTILHFQRRKAEKLAQHLAKELGDFVLPEDTQYSRPF